MAGKDVISSLEDYIEIIRRDRSAWGDDAIAWFRGEPLVDTPLLPKLFRPKVDGSLHNENELLQMFRMKAPAFDPGHTPDRSDTDLILFLAQHVGLPTRLLDWTESALLGLYFALEKEDDVNRLVWMLNPHELNMLSVSESELRKIEGSKTFPLSWHTPKEPNIISEPKEINIGSESINAAWENRASLIPFPVGIQPMYIHPRLSAQRSVFTVHGAIKKSINVILESEEMIITTNIIRRYEIKCSAVDKINKDLHLLGIHESTAFPDLDGLSRELSALY